MMSLWNVNQLRSIAFLSNRSHVRLAEINSGTKDMRNIETQEVKSLDTAKWVIM